MVGLAKNALATAIDVPATRIGEAQGFDEPLHFRKV